MTLLDAPRYDAAGARKRRNLVIGALLCCVVAAIFVYTFWDWPEKHRVERFFQAVEAQDFPKAFAIWNNDPDWQQHPQKYVQAGYPYGRFLSDWNDQSEYGKITSHKIIYVTTLGNGVLTAVVVNGRKTLLPLFVEHKTHTISFTPYDIVQQRNSLGMTYYQISYH
jgi:hypothetical protein